MRRFWSNGSGPEGEHILHSVRLQPTNSRKCLRAKKISPFFQWLALELIGAMVRYGAAEAHHDQVNRILGDGLGPRAEIVDMGYAPPAEPA